MGITASEMGRLGGKRNTEAQKTARRLNLALARKLRWADRHESRNKTSPKAVIVQEITTKG